MIEGNHALSYGNLPRQVFSTQGYPAYKQFSLVQDYYSGIFKIHCPNKNKKTFFFEEDQFTFGPMIAGTMRSDALSFQKIFETGYSYHFFCIVKEHADQKRRFDGVLIFDSRYLVSIKIRKGSYFWLAISHDLISPTTLYHNTLARQHIGGRLGAILRSYLLGLEQQMPDIQFCEAEAIISITVNTIFPILKLINKENNKTNLSQKVIMIKAHDYIIKNIASKRLSVDDICTHIAVSRRTLYRIFCKEGGVKHYIQTERLKKAHHLISLSKLKNIFNIADIAYQVGFNDYNTFRKAFKKHYGYEPKAVHIPVSAEKFVTSFNRNIPCFARFLLKKQPEEN